MTWLSTSTMSSAPRQCTAPVKCVCLLFALPLAGILNLFGGVLIQKKRAEQALEASGMRYTIVR